MELFNEYSNFDSNIPVLSKEGLKKAQDRRNAGAEALTAVNEVINAPQFQPMSEDENIQRLLIFLQQGDGYIPALKEYLRAMDYEPSDNIGELALQVSYARSEQAEELVDKYDPDCYDETLVIDDYESIDLTNEFESEGYDGETYDQYKKRKLINYVPIVAAGRAIARGLRPDEIREEKRKFREEKRKIKQATKLARLRAKQEQALHPENAPIGQNQSTDMAEDQAISTDTANSEIVGEELERDTAGDMETFLPALGGAVALATQISEAKKQGKKVNVKVAWGKLKDLFKKKTPAEKAEIAKSLQLPENATNQDILNKLVSQVEENKKEDYLKKNAPMFIIVLIILLALAFFAGKKS